MTNWIPPEGFLTSFFSNSEEETFSLGRRIAARLVRETNCVIALGGELGSGKTILTKGIASGLGITETITSPTYTIINEYRQPGDSNPAFYHIDAYRLAGDEDFIQIGGREILDSTGISVIEWSERIEKSLPQNAIYITIEITGPSSRTINVKGLHLEPGLLV